MALSRRDVLSLVPALATPRRGLAQPAPRPDIIVFMTDDMRGSDWEVLSPAIDQIGGTWFENFVYTTPLCSPTRAAFLTGQYSHNTGVLKNSRGWHILRERRAQTLPVVMQQAGYRTAWVGKFMGDYDRRNAALGWDYWRSPSEEQGYQLREQGFRGYSTDLYGRQAAEFIKDAKREAPDQPIFLVVSFNAPHFPSTPAKRHQNARVGGISPEDTNRRRTLLAVNQAINRVVNAMGSDWSNACVFMFSDNGWQLPEDGNGDRSGKAIWWDEVTRVPMIAQCPGIAPGSDSRLAASIDLLPTIVRAAGAEAYVDWDVDGRALQDAWDRSAILVEQRAFRNGTKAEWFDAIKRKDEIYVRQRTVMKRGPKGRRRRKWERLKYAWRLLPDENENRLADLDPDTRSAYDSLLAAFKKCSGNICRQLDQ